jgi:predicted dehydrogenase
MKKRSLIIGYGSIGKRHASVLAHLGSLVSLVSSQNIKEFPCHKTVELALANDNFDNVIIATPTSMHYNVLQVLIECKYAGLILVEKPLYAQVQAIALASENQVFVAYNLRFHALFFEAKKLLMDEVLISFSVHVGQYLPTWRKDSDYRKSYSAKSIQGGGVLRDLSHELDYSLWFCGPCIEVTAIGGKFSALEIDSEDTYSILMRCENCPIVTIQMDYLSRMPRRLIIIQTQRHTLALDFINGTLSVDGSVKLTILNAMDKSYEAQHSSLLSETMNDFCGYEEGLNTVKLITAIELANDLRCWVPL